MSRVEEMLARLTPKQRAVVEMRLARRREARPDGRIVPCSDPGRPNPLSFAQQRLWFVDQLEQESSFYNVSNALMVDGALTSAAIAQAIDEVARRHEILRTVFAEEADGPVQRVQAPRRERVPVADLRGLPEEAREREARRQATRTSRRAFDLGRRPLFCVGLLRLGEESHVMVSAFHHALADWWSLRVLAAELTHLYGAFDRGEPSALPELTLQYRDFAAWQRRAETDGRLEADLEHWRERLAGAPPFLRLPTDRPRPPVQTFRGTEKVFHLPRELSDRLAELARAEGVTLFIVVLALYQVLLHHRTGQDDVVVNAPVGNRDRSELAGLIGLFVNTLLFRTRFSGDPGFRQLLEQVRSTVADAYAHQQVPLERIVAEVAPERVLSYSPLLQASVNVIDSDPLAESEPGAGPFLRPMGFPLSTAQFELNLALTRDADGIRGGIHYRVDLFDRSTVEELIEDLRTLAEQVTADGDPRLSELRGALDRNQAERRRSASDRVGRVSMEKLRSVARGRRPRKRTDSHAGVK